MGTSLSGLTPATTFDGLLKVGDNDPLTADLKAISTGDGTDTILQLSNSALSIGGDVTITGTTDDDTANSLLIERLDGTDLFQVRNDRNIYFGSTQYIRNGYRFYGDWEAYGAWDFNNDVNIGTGTGVANTRLLVKGSGTTSATTSLLVQNSAGDDILKATDDRVVSASTFSSTVSRLSYINTITNSYTVMQSHLGDGNASFYNSVAVGQTTTPTARLHVKGSGNDNTTTSLLVQNSDASASLTYDDSGKVEIVGNAQTGFIQTYGFGAVGFGNESGPTIIYGNTGGLFLAGMHTGGGYTAFGANSSSSQRVLIKGSGATSATTSLLVQNSAGTDLLKVTDDGILGLGDTGAQGQINLRRSNDGVVIGTIQGTSNGLYLTNQDGSNHILIGTTSTNGVSVGGGSAPTMGARFGIKGSGNDATTTALLVQNSDGTSMFSIKDSGYIDINPTNSSGGTVQFRGDGTDNLLKVNANDNYVSVGANPPGGTRFFVKGSGTTSATTALLVQNSAGTDLFKVADNGDINIDNGVAADMKVRISPTANKYLEIDRQGRQVRIYSGATGNAGIFMTQADKFSIGVNNAPLLLLDENSNVRIGSGITSADTSAKLQVDSTTQGFLPPRMTDAERDAIATPAAGLMIYDTTNNQMNYWNGSTWIAF
jgi:hypothetical protein